MSTERRWGPAILVGVLASAMVAVAAPIVAPVAASAAERALAAIVSPLSRVPAPLEPLGFESTVVDMHGTTLTKLREEGGGRISTDVHSLPDHVIHAVLAAEDVRFFEHPGIDSAAIARAAAVTLAGGRQGGSTITQQLVKLNYTGSERTMGRKLREAVIAMRLERQTDKWDILERYLNQVYFGGGAYGIEAAARTFFGVPADELTPTQAAALAGKIRSPEGLDPWTAPDAVRARRNDVLAEMHRQGWLTAQLEREATEAPIEVAPPRASDLGEAPWFIEAVKREALTLDELGSNEAERHRRVFGGGLRIETTLDLDAQRAAQAAAVERLGGDPDGPSAAVVSVVPGDGAIRVLVGGLDFATQKFDVATQGHRQPGSAFKPFVYLAAIEKGIHPDSMVDGSSPRRFEHRGERFEVTNYGGASAGRLRLVDALVRSTNTAFMAMGLEVGPQAVADVAADLGVTTKILPVPAIALGGLREGVTPLEMASAYSTLAAGGQRSTPATIERIVDGAGTVLYERSPSVERVIDEREAGVVNAGLRQVVSRGTGRAASVPGLDVAGKTGTTTDYRDAWFIGITSRLATAVWVGNLDNHPMPARLTGGSVPAAIFSVTTKAALDGQDVPALPIASPDDLGLELLAPPTTVAPSTSSTSSSTTSTTAEPARPPNTTPKPKATPKPTTTTVAPTTTTQPRSPTTTTAGSSSSSSGSG